jgi:hypothetical protein
VRTVIASRLPTNWNRMRTYGRLIKHACDIRLDATKRLRLKVLVFKSNSDLRAFWAGALKNRGICRMTNACVTELVAHAYGPPNYDVITRRDVDARYYAVMGLISKRSMSLEIIAHESVHAAYAYDNRLGKRNPFIERPGNDEERICYPAGKITELVYGWLKDVGEIP